MKRVERPSRTNRPTPPPLQSETTKYSFQCRFNADWAERLATRAHVHTLPHAADLTRFDGQTPMTRMRESNRHIAFEIIEQDVRSLFCLAPSSDKTVTLNGSQLLECGKALEALYSHKADPTHQPNPPVFFPEDLLEIEALSSQLGLPWLQFRQHLRQAARGERWWHSVLPDSKRPAICERNKFLPTMLLAAARHFRREGEEPFAEGIVALVRSLKSRSSNPTSDLERLQDQLGTARGPPEFAQFIHELWWIFQTQLPGGLLH